MTQSLLWQNISDKENDGDIIVEPFRNCGGGIWTRGQVVLWAYKNKAFQEVVEYPKVKGESSSKEVRVNCPNAWRKLWRGTGFRDAWARYIPE